MGDESSPNILCTNPTVHESQSGSHTLQETLSRLPSGLRSFEASALSIRKRQIRGEPYEYYRKFTDADPGRSRLCYECNTVMNNLHCHPWSDARRVQIPIGGKDHWAASDDQRYPYRSLRLMDECALCSMILEIVTVKFCPNLEDWPSIFGWRYLLKPTHFGKTYDFDPRRSFGQEVSKWKTRHARWYLGIEIDDPSGSKPPRLIPNAIQGAIRPLPKPFRGICTRREQIIFEQRGFLNGRARDLQCDSELLKSWLCLCDRHHGPQCSPIVDRQEPDIRIIDT